MKKPLLFLLLAAAPAGAAPYFRLLGIKSPQVNVGTCADPVNVGHSQQCTLLSVVSHSHKDGYVLIPGEDWSLLGVGYSVSGEGASMVLGPSWNLSPALGDALSKGAHALLPGSVLDDSMSEIAAANQGGHVNISFGPAWSYDPVRNKGALRIFAGAAWSF